MAQRRGLILLGAVVWAPLVITGCSRPVAVPTPTPATTEVAEVCDRLSSLLPSEVDGAAKRDTEPAVPTTAAWGSPPITLRCGVGRPATLEPTSELVTVNGVDWFIEPLSAGYRFTSTGRVAYIEVSVPKEHKPETSALVDLATPVATANPPAG